METPYLPTSNSQVRRLDTSTSYELSRETLLGSHAADSGAVPSATVTPSVCKRESELDFMHRRQDRPREEGKKAQTDYNGSATVWERRSLARLNVIFVTPLPK